MHQRFPRRSIRARVLYKWLDQPEPSEAGFGWTENLSEGGARVELQTVLAVGCRLGVVICTEPMPLEAEARVVWRWARTVGTVHYGLEFFQLAPAYFDALFQALGQEKSRRRVLRFSLTAPAYCCITGTSRPLIKGTTGNLSRTGALLHLPWPLPQDAEVGISIPPSPHGPLRGRVRWMAMGPRPGSIRHGVEFLGEPLGTERFLSLFAHGPAAQPAQG